MKERTQQTKISVILFVVLLVLAILSSVLLGGHFAKPESGSSNIQALNEKKAKVEMLAGSAAGASAVITLMPGDFGTPIADKLADLSGYFLIILCAIYIEKFLVSIGGVLAFGILVPVGLVILGVALFRAPRTAKSFRKIAGRIIALGIILVALVPISLQISNLVERQHETEIEQTIEAATQSTEAIKGTADRSDDENLWTEFISKIKGGSETLLNKIESLLNNFIDVIAIYIVTTCVIPIVVLIVGIWLIKVLFNVNVPPIGRPPHMSDYTSKKFRESGARRRAPEES